MRGGVLGVLGGDVVRGARLGRRRMVALLSSSSSPLSSPPPSPNLSVAVIGGGPSGYFAAITLASSSPSLTVTVYEASSKLLNKVLISGGGRCNLLPNTALETEAILPMYPRGSKELISPMSASNKKGNKKGSSSITPSQVLDWFNAAGVETKVEKDGRTFPVTDDSGTVASALLEEARKGGVKVVKKALVTEINVVPGSSETPSMFSLFSLTFKESSSRPPVPSHPYAAVILATGSTRAGWDLLSPFNVTIIPPVPSLFTLTCNPNSNPKIIDSWLLEGLAGVSVPKGTVSVAIPEHLRTSKKQKSISQTGPLLITHTGLSGPAALKTSAYAARVLHEMGYKAALTVDWASEIDDVAELLTKFREGNGKRAVGSATPDCLKRAEVPKRLWGQLVEAAGVEKATWSEMSKKDISAVARMVKATPLDMVGKSTFKEEFVTAGGVSLKEIDFRTMMVRKVPGLFVVGEANDVDAVTGGYNFLNCWTSGHVAGKGTGKFLEEREKARIDGV